MFNVKRILSLGLAVGLIMAVAAGCGGNETKLSEAEQALLKDNDKSQTTASVRTDLRLAIQTAPRTLQPEMPHDLSEKAVLDQLYEGLVNWRNNRIRLQQAETIEPAEDGKVWHVKLRPDLKWSDGSKLTADDYRRSWLKHLTTAGAEAYRGFVIEKAAEYSRGEVAAEAVGLQATGDILTITLTQPQTNFPAWLTQDFFFPTKEGADGKPLYNGAYVLEGQEKDALTLKANPEYWDFANVWLKNVHIAVIPDEVQAYEAYHVGNIDFIGDPFYTIGKDRRQAALSSPEKLSFSVARLGYVKLNNFTHKLFATENKRQALYDLTDAPFQADVILKDGSTSWPQRKTPTQAKRTEIAAQLTGDLSKQELEDLKEEFTVGLGGPTILENRLLVGVSKDWLNAVKIKFRLLRVPDSAKVPDFEYTTELAPNGDIDSLLRLWDLRGCLKLDSTAKAAVWADGDQKAAQAATLDIVWRNLAGKSGILPLTTRNALVLARPHLVGVSVDTTGKMLLSDLQWRAAVPR